MLRLKPKADGETPPDLFTYRFPQDGYVSTAFDKTSWFEDIHKHYIDNEYPVPDNWREQAEDQLCRRLSGEWCEGGTENTFINTRFTWDDFARGAKVLGSFALGDGVVSQEVADERARICSQCFANVAIPGCSSCHALANLVGEMKGKKTTRYDHLLKACGVCFCPNSVQVWVEAEHLAKGVTPEMMSAYRTVEHCWKKDALENLLP